jgi:hypothetical protein
MCDGSQAEEGTVVYAVCYKSKTFVKLSFPGGRSRYIYDGRDSTLSEEEVAEIERLQLFYIEELSGERMNLKKIQIGGRLYDLPHALLDNSIHQWQTGKRSVKTITFIHKGIDFEMRYVTESIRLTSLDYPVTAKLITKGKRKKHPEKAEYHKGSFEFRANVGNLMRKSEFTSDHQFDVYCQAVCQCLPDVFCKAFDRHSLLVCDDDERGMIVTEDIDTEQMTKKLLFRKIYGILELDDNDH